MKSEEIETDPIPPSVHLSEKIPRDDRGRKSIGCIGVVLEDILDLQFKDRDSEILLFGTPFFLSRLERPRESGNDKHEGEMDECF